eukprot:731443_1
MATRLNLDLVPVMGVALRVCLKANDYASARRFISGLQSQTERTHHTIVATMLKLACAHNDLEAASKYLRQIPKFGRYQGLVQQCAQTFISAAVKQEEWTLAEKAFGFAAANCNLFKTHTLHGDHRERMNLSDTSSEFMEAAMCQLKNSSTSEPVIVILDTKEDRERCLAAAERLGVSASNHGNVGFYVTLDAQTFIDPEERKALLDAEGRIKRCMENGEPQRALLVLSQAIRDPRFVPTPAIYECGLRAIIASDQTSIELVDSLIQKLISSETQLANPSLLLELCTFLCEKQLGQEVFCPKRMMKLRQAGMNLSIDDFNRLISKASEHKSSPKVEDFTTWLRHFRITPNQKSFRLALDLYEPSVALTVITRFERLKFVHTETSLNAVALLCLQHRKYDTAAEYFQKFADSGFQLDKTVAARVLPTIETSQTLGSLSMLDTLSSVGHPLSKDDWQRLVAMHEISGRSDMADEVMARACRTEEFRECQLTEDGVLLLAGVSEIAAKVFTRRALESLIRSPESGLRQIRVTVASESARKQVELAAQESSAFVLPSDDPFVVILSMEPPMTSSRLLNMMNSHISAGNISKAIGVFFDSLSKDLRPDDSVFSRALDCCDSARALEILSLIQASEIRVQPEHAHKALSVLLSADKLEEAERFLDSLEKFGVSLDETMCQEIICAFGQSAELDKARIYFDRISQISPKPSERSFAVMVEACACAGDFGAAQKMFMECMEDGFLTQHRLRPSGKLVLEGLSHELAQVAFSFAIDEFRSRADTIPHMRVSTSEPAAVRCCIDFALIHDVETEESAGNVREFTVPGEQFVAGNGRLTEYSVDSGETINSSSYDDVEPLSDLPSFPEIPVRPRVNGGSPTFSQRSHSNSFRTRRGVYKPKPSFANPQKILEEFESQLESGIPPQETALSNYFEACRQTNSFERAKTTFSDVFSPATVSQTLCSARVFNSALSVFLESDLEYINTIFERMLELDVLPNQTTTTSVLRACSCSPDTATALSYAKRYFQVAQKSNASCSSKTAQVMIISCMNQDNNLPLAKGLFDLLQQNGYKPDIAILNVLIRICSTVGDADSGMEYMRLIEQSRMYVNDLTVYNCIRLVQSNPAEVKSIYDRYCVKGSVKPSQHILELMIFSCSKQNDIESIFYYLDKLLTTSQRPPAFRIFRTVAIACIHALDIRALTRTLELMLTHKVKPDRSLLQRILCTISEAGDSESMRKCVNLIRQNGVQWDAGLVELVVRSAVEFQDLGLAEVIFRDARRCSLYRKNFVNRDELDVSKLSPAACLPALSCAFTDMRLSAKNRNLPLQLKVTVEMKNLKQMRSITEFVRANDLKMSQISPNVLGIQTKRCTGDSDDENIQWNI